MARTGQSLWHPSATWALAKIRRAVLTLAEPPEARSVCSAGVGNSQYLIGGSDATGVAACFQVRDL